MKKAPLHLVTAFILAFGMSSAASAKELFDNFYFFGDSLTDMGNAGNAPYTNGSTWANDFANKFGDNATPSNNGGNDYALVGAFTAMVVAQERAYLASVNNSVDPKALYSVWAGANDVTFGILEFEESPTSIINTGVGNTNTIVQELHNAGAKYIMVFNLPDLGRTPLGQYYGAYASSVLSQTSAAYNQTLASTLNAEGFDVIQLDIYSLFNDFLNDPGHFGLANTTQLFYTPNGGNPNQDEHPTAYGHQMIADYAYSVVTGPEYAAVLTAAPLSAVGSVMEAQNLNIENQIFNVRTGMANLAVGQTSAFGSASYTPYKQDSQGTVIPGFDAHSTDLTAGLIHRINNNFIVGAGVARSFGHVSFAHNTGSFNMRENIASLFGGYQYHNFYVDGIVNYGILDYTRVTRKITIGVSTNSATGDTSGSQVGTDLIFGYNIINQDNLQTGPIVNADYQFVRVNAYSESGSIDGIAEQFDNQTANSFVTGLGWQFNYKFNVNNTPVMPFAQVSYNHEWINGDRDVGAGLTSIPGSHFTIPVEAVNSDFGLGSVGVSFGITKNVTMSLAYQTTLFMQGGRTQNANANIQVSL